MVGTINHLTINYAVDYLHFKITHTTRERMERDERLIKGVGESSTDYDETEKRLKKDK